MFSCLFFFLQSFGCLNSDIPRIMCLPDSARSTETENGATPNLDGGSVDYGIFLSRLSCLVILQNWVEVYLAGVHNQAFDFIDSTVLVG